MDIKITLCMIVKNEEAVLARCLDSVSDLADEIVIADTGSTDNTREIAKSYTKNIFSYSWTEDFAAARNFSFSKASGDYIFWLDADDVILPADQAKFRLLKERLNALSESDRPDVIMCRYESSSDEKNEAAFSYYRERILKRKAKPLWQGCVHECIPPQGKIEYSDFRVIHKPVNKPRGSRNLNVYQKNIARGYTLSPRDKFYYGRELYYNRLYTEAEAVLTDMLKEPNGWYVNKIEACKILSLSYRAQGYTFRALNALFDSFAFGEPRSGILTEIGNIFKSEKRYGESIFWYEAAMNCRDHSAEGDFDTPAERTLIPLLELTYCCYAHGDKDKALYYHRQAAKLAPAHPSVIYNEAFFKGEKLP